MNGASGTSDIEGKAARVAASEAGAERVSTPMDTNEDRQIRVYSCVLVVKNLISGPHSSLFVLLVADVFHPLNHFSVQSLLNGDMRHRRRRTCAMPVFFARRKPDHIARSNFFDRSAFALRPTKARRDDQRLTERMRMPGSAGTRFERDARATNTCRIRRLEQRINAHTAGKPISRSLARRLRSGSFYFHISFSTPSSAFQRFSSPLFRDRAYLSAEKLVGSMKYRSIWSTSGPLASDSAFTFCHSGSAWKAAQFFSAS